MASDKGLPTLSRDAASQGVNRTAPTSYDEAVITLRQFVHTLNQKIDRLSQQQYSSKQFAREVLAVLRSLVREESNAGVVRDPVENLFQRLWGAPGIKQIFEQLYDRSAEVLDSTSAAPLEHERSVSALEEIIDWYERRRRNLIELEFRPQSGGDRIFSVSTQLSRRSVGGEGIEIRCGLQLVERLKQTLWLRVRVLRDGCLVNPAPGAESWIERTDLCLQAAPENAPPRDLPFCSLLLVVVGAEKSLVDSAKVWVPFCALDLQAGSTNLTFECSLLDNLGELVHEVRQDVACRIADTKPTAELRSPQSMGLWSAEPVSALELSDIQVRQLESPLGGDILELSVETPPCVDAESPLRLEWRLLTADGYPVEAALLENTDSSGSVAMSVSLLVGGGRSARQCVTIPLEALHLPEGRHALLSIVSITDNLGLRLCGDFHVHEVLVSANKALPATPSVQQLSIMSASEGEIVTPRLARFEVEHGCCVGKVSCIRFVIGLTISQVLLQAYKIVCSIEPQNDGRGLPALRGKPVRHTVVYSPDPRDSLMPSCSVVMPLQELADAGLFKPEVGRLVARVQVYAQDQTLLLNRTRLLPMQIAELFSTAVERAVPTTEGALRMEDVQLQPEPGRLLLRSLVSIHIKPLDLESRKFSVYHEVVTADGASLHQTVGTTPGLSGQVERIEIPASMLQHRFGTEEVQYGLRIEDQLRGPLGQVPNPGLYSIKLMLFSEAGMLLQTLLQPFLLKGVAQNIQSLSIEKYVVGDGEGNNQAGLLRGASQRFKLLGKLFSQ
jgi:hypothetical protein